MKLLDLNEVGAKGAIVEEAEGKWGMVIDQDLCTGCQACVAACAMENNIAFVGEEDAGYGRSMQWMRIERFWEGEYPEVKMTSFQPTLCQQCGHAPCEPVCPVFAAVHSPGRRPEPAGLQPLCGYTLLRQQLSLPGARLQLARL